MRKNTNVSATNSRWNGMIFLFFVCLIIPPNDKVENKMMMSNNPESLNCPSTRLRIRCITLKRAANPAIKW